MMQKTSENMENFIRDLKTCKNKSSRNPRN